MTIATQTRPTDVELLVEAAMRIARQGHGRYHVSPGAVAEMWRRATGAHWARLAVLAAVMPPDTGTRAEVIAHLHRSAVHGAS